MSSDGESKDSGLSLRLRQVLKRRTQGGVTFELSVPGLELAAGRFVAVVGPSGCGKSTLLDILGLVLSPDRAGEMSLNLGRGLSPLQGLGQAELAAVRRNHIGYVLQTGGLLPFLNVRQNIALPLKLCSLPSDGGRVEKLAQALGIAEQLDKSPRHLSGGQRQRAAIARALVHQPRLVLADEPTAAVDQLTAREIRDQFRRLSRSLGLTVLMVTHDLELVRGVVDQAYTFQLERPEPGFTRAVLQEGALS